MAEFNKFSKAFIGFLTYKIAQTLIVYMLDVFCGLRQGLVHCGFIFSYKESTPAALDPQFGKDPKSQFSLKERK